ncbi:MAG: PqqD family peptide modification chaperone [Candidatus Coatesbacteria bacterium]|nr:PqqD family peptide modification chaperone [Candidatus Coatesbacteria bacterium]
MLVTSSDSRPKVPEGAFNVRRANEHLLLHPRLPRFALLNATAMFMASLCDGTRTIAEIADAVAAHYGIEAEQVLPDVEMTVSQLKRSGMLDDLDDSREVSYARANKRVHLTITGHCNLRCAHCGAIGSLNKRDGLSTSDVKRIIDQLSERPETSIAITGGEPLLRKDIVEIVEYSCERTRTILSTNGTLITDDLARSLGPLPIIFQISLDGATAAIHDMIRGIGQYDRALNGIRLLQEHGAGSHVEVCRTVMGQPDEDFGALLELGQKLGLGGIRFLCLARLGRAESDYDILSPTFESYRRFYENYFQVLLNPNKEISIGGGIPGLYLDVPEGEMWCHVGEMLEVDPEGKIFPCSMLNHPEYELGDVREMSLQQAAGGEKFMELHRMLSNRIEEIEACRNCPFKNYCQGGCPGMALVDNGTFFAQDSICELRKELFRDLFFDVLPKLKSDVVLSSSEEIQI